MFQIDIKDVFGRSWEAWTKQIGQVILYSLMYIIGIFVLVLPLLFVLIATVAGMLTTPFLSHSQEEQLGALGSAVLAMGMFFFLMLLALLILLPAWQAGYLYVMRKLLLGEVPTFSDLFTQFRKIIHILLAGTIVGIIVIIGIVLLVIPGIVFYILLSQTLYLIIDRDMDFASAISASWNRVGRDFWMITGILILLLIAQVGVSMVLSAVPFIGDVAYVLLGLPYFQMASWVLYFALFPRETPQTAFPSPPVAAPSESDSGARDNS